MRALRAPDPFIFCLDNGAAYVSTGLLARLQNDSQLAMLLAPELNPDAKKAKKKAKK